MNSKMMQRKTELDAMLGDSQRYEAKRNEVEVWLARMETRLEKMRAVGHTADVLEAQLREQKVRIYVYIYLSFLLAFFSLLSSETRPVFHINPSSRGKPTAPLGGSPSLSLLRPSMARATGRTEGDHRLIAPIRVD